MAEYALLTGVSLIVFLSLGAALNAFTTSAEDDVTVMAAYNVATSVVAATCDTVGSGNVSSSAGLDLPEQICGMPYVAYPSQDGRGILIGVCSSTVGRAVRVPLPLRAEGVRVSGFIASPPAGHEVDYDAATRTVHLS